MPVEIYTPMTSKALSQRKLDEYNKLTTLINHCRENPVWAAEFLFGVQLMDFQRYMIHESWTRSFVCWLGSRGIGKTSIGAVFLMLKMMLIPNYNVYIATNSASQSIEVFKKIEDIALQRIPSFRSVTDIFANEVDKPPNSQTGFLHNPVGHTFKLYNGSQLTTLSANTTTIRGKRGSVYLDEVAFSTREMINVVENFINVDADFKLGTNYKSLKDPKPMPLQLLYSSSAGDVDFAFFERYKNFSKRMILGDPNYFVCDFNCDVALNYSSVNGKLIKSHLTREQIEKAIEEDPELAERELFNKFRKGAGINSVVNIDVLIRNSVTRVPLLFNDTRKKKFVFCYDPARTFDGSILSIWQEMYDNERGYWLQIENCISMVDRHTKKKTPLPMPQQLEIIQEQMILYNGEGVPEWENLTFLIDAGSGGGGVSAVADQLMLPWTSGDGVEHRGIIDPTHKQYESARMRYSHADPIVKLVEPTTYKKIIFDALSKMSNLNLMKYTAYDNKPYLMLEQTDGRKKEQFEQYMLSEAEQLILAQVNLMKTEISSMVKGETANGNVTYEIARDKMDLVKHDDRAYTAAMAAYHLFMKRRDDLTEIKETVKVTEILVSRLEHF